MAGGWRPPFSVSRVCLCFAAYGGEPFHTPRFAPYFFSAHGGQPKAHFQYSKSVSYFLAALSRRWPPFRMSRSTFYVCCGQWRAAEGRLLVSSRLWLASLLRMAGDRGPTFSGSMFAFTFSDAWRAAEGRLSIYLG